MKDFAAKNLNHFAPIPVNEILLCAYDWIGRGEIEAFPSCE
jgi:hypothetical protein